MKYQTKNTLSKNQGFTIVEILVSLAISTMLMAGLVKVVVDVNRGTQLVESISVQQDNSRIAFQILHDAVVNSGHWGGLKGSDITAASSLSLTASGNCNESWITNTNEPIRGYDGAASIGATNFPTDCISAADYQAETDIFVVRYADPEVKVQSANVGSGSNANTIFVRTILGDSNLGNVGEVFKGSDGITSLLSTGDPLATYNYAYRSDIYFIRPCNADLPSCDNVSTLVRMRYSGSAYTTEALVENVEQMQLAFGSDTDGDFTVDRYDAPSAVTNWDNVINIRFDLVVRNTETSAEYSDSSTYSLAGGFSYDVASANEKYRRSVYSKSVQIRNLNRI